MSEERLAIEEVVKLAAVDERLYCQFFFPQTYRDEMPGFAGKLWQDARDPRKRLLNWQIFRGGSKTTNLRGITSYRIAYGISRTILFISKSEGHARYSISWLKNQVERNKEWTLAYGLAAAESPWTDLRLNIRHNALGHSVNILGMGILGSVRGLNIDDYRPDLIILDDVIDDENSATPEQREKIENLILGAVVNSLAPKSENPDAKAIMLQTPFSFEDASMQAFKDEMWSSFRQGCWTLKTEELPLEYRESVWPARFPSEELRQEKRGHLARNKASVFAREKECKLITPETSDFRSEWLRFFTINDEGKIEIEGARAIDPRRMSKVIAIDPVPPPSEREVEKALHGKDYEAIGVIGYHMGRYIVLEYKANRGHEPNWTINTFFELWMRWHARALIVEPTNYQRTLKWLISQEMMKRGRYIPILERENPNRAKRDKVVQALSGPASMGQLYAHAQQTELISQFAHFPNLSHDDVLDMVAMGVEGLMWSELDELIDEEEEEPIDMHEERGVFKFARGAP